MVIHYTITQYTKRYNDLTVAKKYLRILLDDIVFKLGI